MQRIHNSSSTIRAATEWSFFRAMYVLVYIHLLVPWKLNSACSGLHATTLQLLGHIFFRMTCVRCDARSHRSGVCTGLRATRRYHLWVLNRQHKEAHLFCSTEGFFLNIYFLFFLFIELRNAYLDLELTFVPLHSPLLLMNAPVCWNIEQQSVAMEPKFLLHIYQNLLKRIKDIYSTSVPHDLESAVPVLGFSFLLAHRSCNAKVASKPTLKTLLSCVCELLPAFARIVGIPLRAFDHILKSAKNPNNQGL